MIKLLYKVNNFFLVIIFFKDLLKYYYNENYLLLKELFNVICIYDFLDVLVVMEKVMKCDNIKVNDR